jgi:alginate O-acetyltransferase complex protein AlgI
MFWKGWHITLNSWFRDYFFYEIVRWDKKRNFTNLLLFITFIAIALWHDITWVFLIWGTLNATWLILERKFRKRFPEFKVSNWIGTVYHTVLASFLATVFISDSPANLWNSFFQTGSQNADLSAFMKPNSLIVFLAFTYMDWVEKKCGKLNISAYLDTWSEKKRILWYLLIILGIWILNDSDDLSNYYNMF